MAKCVRRYTAHTDGHFILFGFLFYLDFVFADAIQKKLNEIYCSFDSERTEHDTQKMQSIFFLSLMTTQIM